MSSSSIAAKKVGSNQYLLLQIISRLPIKSVLRFKSLSKTLLSLIEEFDPHLRRRTSCDPVNGLFLRMALGTNARKIRSYRQDRKVKYKHQYIPLDPINNRPLSNEYEYSQAPTGPSGDKFVIQSSNGLFLCFSLESGRFYVYNPTTLSYITIPNHPNNGNDSNERSATLAFDPVTSFHYKLILATGSQIYIYSSETRTWSRGITCKIPTRRGLKNGIYWNGSVHWMVTTLDNGCSYLGYREPETSMRFHVDTQTRHKIPEPLKPRTHTFECNRYFGETGGHLHYIDSGVDNSIQIQEMKTDYSEWFVKYRVNLSKVIKDLSNHDYPVNGYCRRGGDGKFRDFDFLSVIRSGEEKGVLLLWANKTVISCNLINRKFKTIAEFSDDYEPGPGILLKHNNMDRRIEPSFELDSSFPFIPSFSDTE